MGRPDYNPDEIRALTGIARGLGCPDDARHVLPLLAATGCLRKYDGPYMEGASGSYVLTFFGHEEATKLLGWRWEGDCLVDDNGLAPRKAAKTEERARG